MLSRPITFQVDGVTVIAAKADVLASRTVAITNVTIASRKAKSLALKIEKKVKKLRLDKINPV